MYLISTHTTYNSSSEAADLIRFRYHRDLLLVAILNVMYVDRNLILDSKNMLVRYTLQFHRFIARWSVLRWQLDSSQLSDSQNRPFPASPVYSQLNPRYTHSAFIVSHCFFYFLISGLAPGQICSWHCHFPAGSPAPQRDGSLATK